MPINTQVIDAIDQSVEFENNLEFPFRNHLGGSLIGRPCLRELWYSFRWARKPSFAGRMLRLFERGHLEEFRFVKYLKMAGFEIQAYSQRLLYHVESDNYEVAEWGPVTDADLPDSGVEDVTDDGAHVQRAATLGTKLKQWRISDVRGHFGGSLDGKGRLVKEGSIPGVPDGQGLLEFKTHNAKSFEKLEKEGLAKAKPEHYSQQQIYMHKTGLLWSLYLAVNKNTDALYCEIVFYEEDDAAKLLKKAHDVINCLKVPPRIHGANHPSFHVCVWCDYKKICHYAEPMEPTCRSCQFVEPVEDGQWKCHRWDAIIPSDAIINGCDNYKQITD